MSTQTISRPPRPTDEPNTDTLDAERNGQEVAARRQAPRSRSTFQPRPMDPRTAPSPAPSFDGRPRGHVVGNGIGSPPPPWFAGRPHGHIVGHPVGEAPSLSRRATYQKAA